MRLRACLVGQANPVEPLERFRRCVPFTGKKQRQFHVLENGKRGQQLEELKNKANPIAAQRGERGIGERTGGLAVDEHRAGIGEIHRARKVEQRGLAAAASSKQGGYGAGGNGERHLMQGGERLTAIRIGFGDALDLQARGQDSIPICVSR